MIKAELPKSPEGFRKAIYSGEIFLTAPTPITNELATYVKSKIVESFGERFREAYKNESANSQGAWDDTFFLKVGILRKQIFADIVVHKFVSDLIQSLGLDPTEFVFEPPKLRAVSHNGHKIPAAAPVYYGHRDTWYSTPQSSINFWMPLSDLSAEETFVFYPEFFDQKIPNDSSGFCFEKDQLKIGWEKKTDGLKNIFPTMRKGFDPGPAVGFAPSFASLLIFSGSHFHQTLEQMCETTRFSIDFRVVHIADAENNVGAPNVDNESQGSCLPTYIEM